MKAVSNRLPPCSQNASSRIEPEEKLRKSSNPRATIEAGFENPGIVRFGMAVPLAPSFRPEIVVLRRAAFSMSYSSPAPCRHWSCARRLPRLSAQLMPGAENSSRPARIASPAASTSKL